MDSSAISKIIAALERKKLSGGGDGSVKKGKGSHAWEFAEGGNKNTICQGSGSVDGPSTTMCSYGAEANHLLAMLTLLQYFQSYIERKKKR